MKLFYDILPVILFFAVFKTVDIYWATATAILASSSQIGWRLLTGKRPETTVIITFLMILLLGGATLLLHEEIYIKWKPTAVYWALSLAFCISQFVGQKPLVQRMLEKNVSVKKALWTKLNLSWVAFFFFMGCLNIFVLYNFDTNTWVNFKLFGSLLLTLIFVIGQGLVLAKYVPHPEKSKTK